MSLLIKGVTNLSELTIDADKDWQGKGISNIGTVVITDGADHYIELPSLTTAQRDALTPSTGMTIWNSDNARVEKYNGATWDSMGIAGVKVRKNSQMPVIGVRPQLNLIEGAATDIKIADNPPDDEIDVTISAKYPTRFMTLIPSDASLPTSNPAAKATVDGTNFAYDVLDFDHTTEESANWEWYLTPDYLSENIVVDILWTSAGAGDAKFGFSVLGREKGETWDTALGTEQTVVTTNLGAGLLNKSRISTFSPGWSPGDAILFKLARKAADAADTINANDVRVLKVVVSYTGQFAQSFYPLPQAVQLTISGASAWVDVDVSSYVPVGATGVIIHAENTYASSGDVGLRKKGSTDNRSDGILPNSHLWGAIGLDENRKFQVYASSTTYIKIYLVAYTATGVVFFDNAYDKTPPALPEEWKDIDCSAECPGAIGLIFECIGGAGIEDFGMRKKTSTDDRRTSNWQIQRRQGWFIVGCNASQVTQGYYHTDTKYWLIGYITQGAVFKTTGVNKNLSVENEWTDIDCSGEAPSAIMLFFECAGAFGMRKNGSTEEIYRSGKHSMAMVACDSGQVVEGKIPGIIYPYHEFFLVGYATWAGA